MSAPSSWSTGRERGPSWGALNGPLLRHVPPRQGPSLVRARCPCGWLQPLPWVLSHQEAPRPFLAVAQAAAPSGDPLPRSFQCSSTIPRGHTGLCISDWPDLSIQEARPPPNPTAPAKGEEAGTHSVIPPGWGSLALGGPTWRNGGHGRHGQSSQGASTSGSWSLPGQPFRTVGPTVTRLGIAHSTRPAGLATHYTHGLNSLTSTGGCGVRGAVCLLPTPQDGLERVSPFPKPHGQDRCRDWSPHQPDPSS